MSVPPVPPKILLKSNVCFSCFPKNVFSKHAASFQILQSWRLWEGLAVTRPPTQENFKISPLMRFSFSTSVPSIRISVHFKTFLVGVIATKPAGTFFRAMRVFTSVSGEILSSGVASFSRELLTLCVRVVAHLPLGRITLSPPPAVGVEHWSWVAGSHGRFRELTIFRSGC